MCGDRAGPVALHEYVRLAQQLRKLFAAAWLTQVDLRRQFSSACVDDKRQHRGSMRGGHQQHIGAMGGERAAADRASDDMG